MWTYKVSKTETQKSGVLLLLEGWYGETEGAVIVPSLATRNNTPKVKELVSQTLWLNQLVAESVVEFMNFGGM